MAQSFQEIRNACLEIKATAKQLAGPVEEVIQYLADGASQLEVLVQGNNNSGPKAVHAIRQAGVVLGQMHSALDTMNRALDGFINEQASK